MPPRQSEMASRRKRSSAAEAAAAHVARRKRMEQLKLNMCTCWTANPTYDPKFVLLRRLFFINGDSTKYVSVGFCPARDYLTLVKFRVVLIGGGPKTIKLSDEQVDAVAERPPKLREGMSCWQPACGSR